MLATDNNCCLAIKCNDGPIKYFKSENEFKCLIIAKLILFDQTQLLKGVFERCIS